MNPANSPTSSVADEERASAITHSYVAVLSFRGHKATPEQRAAAAKMVRRKMRDLQTVMHLLFPEVQMDARVTLNFETSAGGSKRCDIMDPAADEYA